MKQSSPKTGAGVCDLGALADCVRSMALAGCEGCSSERQIIEIVRRQIPAKNII